MTDRIAQQREERGDFITASRMAYLFPEVGGGYGGRNQADLYYEMKNKLRLTTVDQQGDPGTWNPDQTVWTCSDRRVIGTRLEGVLLDWLLNVVSECTIKAYDVSLQPWCPVPELRIGAHPEAFFIGRNIEQSAVAEIKTAAFPASRDWTPDGLMPKRYIIQCQTQMLCAGVDVCYLGVLLDGSQFRIYKVARSEKIIDQIKARTAEFFAKWFDADVEPPQVPVTETLDRLNTIPAGLTESDLQEHVEMLTRWQEKRQERLDADKAENAAKDELRAAMGENEAMRLTNGTVVGYKKHGKGRRFDILEVVE